MMAWSMRPSCTHGRPSTTKPRGAFCDAVPIARYSTRERARVGRTKQRRAYGASGQWSDEVEAGQRPLVSGRGPRRRRALGASRQRTRVAAFLRGVVLSVSLHRGPRAVHAAEALAAQDPDVPLVRRGGASMVSIATTRTTWHDGRWWHLSALPDGKVVHWYRASEGVADWIESLCTRERIAVTSRQRFRRPRVEFPTCLKCMSIL